MRTFARTTALLSVVAALVIPTTAAEAASGPFGSPGDVITTPVQFALKALPVADSAPSALSMKRAGFTRPRIDSPSRLPGHLVAASAAAYSD